MTLGALQSFRATWPQARIQLVVGSWNADIARQLPWVDSVETLDAPWLAREDAPATPAALFRRAQRWKRERFDLAMNLEGDIRSNILMALSAAPLRVGFAMAGGGSLLTDVVSYDPRAHTDENTRRVVRAAAARLGIAAIEPPPSWPRFSLPPASVERADRLLGEDGTRAARRGSSSTPAAVAPSSSGIPHGSAGGGPDRAAVGAAIVLTGTDQDRPLVDEARAAIRAASPSSISQDPSIS